MRNPVAPAPGVSLANAVIRQEGDCPVCGAAVAPPVAACPDCSTPHHRDCWTYNRGCAIFGCAERLEHPPAVVRPAPLSAAQACPACNNAVRGEAIRCVACRSLHHQRCFERAGRCSQNGCPLSGDVHPGAPLPEKILLPQVAMAFFSGLYYFPPIFAAWCIFWVAFAPQYLMNASTFMLAMACYGLVAAGFLAGGLWSDRYNLNLKRRAITRSWMLAGVELVEAHVADLDAVQGLWLGRPGDHLGPVALQAKLDGRRDPLPLTPGMSESSEGYREVQQLLWKLHVFSIVPVDPRLLTVTET